MPTDKQFPQTFTETDSAIEISVDVPGIDQKDLDFTPGENDVDATYEKDILNLRIKKLADAEVKSRKIEIKTV